MQVAIVNGNTVTAIGEYKRLFPNVSFPPTGPDAAWMAANHVMPVSVYLTYDPATQKLVTVSPYVQGSYVYTVQVQPLSAAEIAANQQAQAIQIGQQAQAALSATDWTAVPSVADANVSNPYLTNQPDFLAYRSALRAIAISPTYDATLPTRPAEKWSNNITVSNATANGTI